MPQHPPPQLPPPADTHLQYFKSKQPRNEKKRKKKKNPNPTATKRATGLREHKGEGRTMIVVAGKVGLVDVEVMVFVQLPELAVDDVEVLVGEKLCHLVDVLLFV